MTVRNRKQNSSLANNGDAYAVDRRNGDNGGVVRRSTGSSWFSSNPSKAYGEKFFAIWSVIWIGMVALVVVTRVFEVRYCSCKE